MEDTAEADAVLEDLVDLEYSIVRLLRSAVRHIIDVQHHLLHLPYSLSGRREEDGRRIMKSTKNTV